MDSNRYGWYYAKTNMPIWIFLTPGRWWAELEFHLAGNGRLFLSGRRRRSVVWHLIYTLLFYALLVVGIAYLLGGGSRASSRAAEPPAAPMAAVAPRLDRDEAASAPAPRAASGEAAYEEIPAPAEAVPLEPALAEAVEALDPPSEPEKVPEAGTADALKDLY